MTQIPRKGKIRQIYIYIYFYEERFVFRFFAKILRFSIPRNIPVVKFYDSKEDFLLLSLFVCLEFRRNKNSQNSLQIFLAANLYLYRVYLYSRLRYFRESIFDFRISKKFARGMYWTIICEETVQLKYV